MVKLILAVSSLYSNTIFLDLILQVVKDLIMYVYDVSSMVYVTGYWKTDHNVTLGQLHFIGPANSHTHALSMHSCITGLS